MRIILTRLRLYREKKKKLFNRDTSLKALLSAWKP